MKDLGLRSYRFSVAKSDIEQQYTNVHCLFYFADVYKEKSVGNLLLPLKKSSDASAQSSAR